MPISNRLKKLERVVAPETETLSVIHVIYERGPDGPIRTGEAIAVCPGINLPRIEKHANETHEEFTLRVRRISDKAKSLEDMSDENLKSAIDEMSSLRDEILKELEND